MFLALRCSHDGRIWWSTTVHLMAAKKQKETKRGARRDIIPKDKPLAIYFLQGGPTSESVHHLPIMPPNYESINGSTH
jgi:hypothetical protein